MEYSYNNFSIPINILGLCFGIQLLGNHVKPLALVPNLGQGHQSSIYSMAGYSPLSRLGVQPASRHSTLCAILRALGTLYPFCGILRLSASSGPRADQHAVGSNGSVPRPRSALCLQQSILLPPHPHKFHRHGHQTLTPSPELRASARPCIPATRPGNSPHAANQEIIGLTLFDSRLTVITVLYPLTPKI